MDTSPLKTLLNSGQKRSIKLFHPRLWSLRWKTRIIFMLSLLAVICILVTMTVTIQRKQAVQKSCDQLVLLQTTKEQYITDYFRQLDRQLTRLSTDRQVPEMLSMFSESYLNIVHDNCYTPDAPDSSIMISKLERFYTAEVIPALEDMTDKGVSLKALLPNDSRQKILQYLYLAGNSKPLTAKGSINKADDASAYSSIHDQYHPEMQRFARELGVSDILLADYESGDVVYSMSKNLDFATNLFDGPYKNSALALAFKSALAQSQPGTLSYVDESQYLPALFKPIFFISAPVFSGSQLKGAIIFALDVSVMDNLLRLDTDGITSGKTQKAFILGRDLSYRSNDPGFLADREAYIKKLKRNSNNGENHLLAEKLNTTALIQTVDQNAFSETLHGKSNTITYTTETGEQVFAFYGQVKIDDLGWILVSQIDRSEALSPVRTLAYMILAIGIFLGIILFIIACLLGNSLTGRLDFLKDSLDSIYRGNKVRLPADLRNDEIGKSLHAIHEISRRLDASSTFLDEIGKGNTDAHFEVLGEDDQFGNSMISLKENIEQRMSEEEKRQKEDEIRNWSTNGIAMFNDILRTDSNDIEKLSYHIIRNMIEYLSANQGGLFLMEEEGNTKFLNLVAAYAYDRQKFISKRIGIGEGLVGTCVLEKKTTLLKKIPDNYLEITSGLGGSKPGCLMIVPLLKNEEVLGVIEIASFNLFKPHEVEFIEKVAESIAAAMITVRLHMQTSQYLERFQQQAEEMKAQEEELRQNIEELQATHEQIERLKQDETMKHEKTLKELEGYRKLLQNILDSMPGKIFIKDHDGRFLFVNTAVARFYNKSVEELAGTSEIDRYTPDEAKKIRDKELEIMAGDSETFIQEESLAGGTKYFKTIKVPFYLPHLERTGLLGFQTDVTDIRLLEDKIHELQGAMNRLRDNA